VLVATEKVTTLVFPTLLAALLTVTVWKVVTGGLHLDGLADCLDGLVGRDPEHRLAIMRDSRIGAFGALGLILFLLLELAAVAELPQAVRWRVLLAAPAIARALPPLLARAFPAARPHGHGAAFRAGLHRGSAAVALALGAAVAFGALGPMAAVALAAAVVVALAGGWFMAGRLGGISGDVLGASVEVAELAVLLTVSAWAHAGLT
jgi:adenosylcobinamide-GDP ribazoletransferase